MQKNFSVISNDIRKKETVYDESNLAWLLGLPIDAQVSLTINNVLGQRVAVMASGRYPAGSYTVRWEPATAASGIYFYQLNTGRYISSRRMTLLK